MTTIDPDRTVYVATWATTSGPVTLHLYRDCRCIKNSKQVRSHDRSEYQDDVNICGWCEGDVESDFNGSAGLWQKLEKMGKENTPENPDPAEQPVWRRQQAQERGHGD